MRIANWPTCELKFKLFMTVWCWKTSNNRDI